MNHVDFSKIGNVCFLKRRANNLSEKDWTKEDESELKKLRRRKAKVIRDKKRVRKYSPRKKDGVEV
jgi:hypothetical protein